MSNNDISNIIDIGRIKDIKPPPLYRVDQRWINHKEISEQYQKTQENKPSIIRLNDTIAYRSVHDVPIKVDSEHFKKSLKPQKDMQREPSNHLYKATVEEEPEIDAY